MIFMADFPKSLLLLAYFKQLTDQVLDDTAKANGSMTVNQLELIAILGQQMTMKEVADALRMHPSNVTGLVNNCTEAGWVERVPSKSDKRTKHLVLTHMGTELRNKILRDIARHLQEISGITDDIAVQILSHIKSLESA